jgi:hypothetical protein
MTSYGRRASRVGPFTFTSPMSQNDRNPRQWRQLLCAEASMDVRLAELFRPASTREASAKKAVWTARNRQSTELWFSALISTAIPDSPLSRPP